MFHLLTYNKDYSQVSDGGLVVSIWERSCHVVLGLISIFVSMKLCNPLYMVSWNEAMLLGWLENLVNILLDSYTHYRELVG